MRNRSAESLLPRQFATDAPRPDAGVAPETGAVLNVCQKGRSESERTNRRNPPQREVGYWVLECQGFPPPTRWPVLVRKKLGSARSRLPAEVEGGNSG